MLKKINDPYLIYEKNGNITIVEDCPKDRLQRYKEIDEDFFQKRGEHLYTNFETKK